MLCNSLTNVQYWNRFLPEGQSQHIIGLLLIHQPLPFLGSAQSLMCASLQSTHTQNNRDMLKEIVLFSHRHLEQLNAESSPLEVIAGAKMEKSCEGACCCSSGQSHIPRHPICRFLPNAAYLFVILNCLT